MSNKLVPTAERAASASALREAVGRARKAASALAGALAASEAKGKFSAEYVAPLAREVHSSTNELLSLIGDRP